MFECYTTESGKWRFRLKASNGQIILVSESYESKDGCENGIASVKENARSADSFEKLTSENGKAYFNLKAANGQVIGTSEMYESEAGRDNGIESVMGNAPDADVSEVA
jgi:uncharacterized protein YegP (UPF0339 family)